MIIQCLKDSGGDCWTSHRKQTGVGSGGGNSGRTGEKKKGKSTKARIKEVKVAMDDRWVFKKKCLRQKRHEGQRRGDVEMAGGKEDGHAECVCV